MFGTIRKHQAGLWLIIIAAMIVSLLIFFVPEGGLPGTRGRDGGNFGSIYGKQVNQKDWLEARREMELFHFFRTGNWPGNEDSSGPMMESAVLQRLLLVQKMKELEIHPAEKAMAVVYQNLLGNGNLASFEQEYLSKRGLSAADLNRFIKHEVGIEQIRAAAGVSAKFVSPAEAEVFYRKLNQETEVQLALFWASNYMDQVVITNGAIGLFYTQRVSFMYRVPERTIVSYVEFPATNYFAEADKEMAAETNLTETLNQNWLRHDTNEVVFKDDKGVPLGEEAFKQQFKNLLRTNYALVHARRAAGQFGNELYEIKPDPNKLENFEKLAAEKKLVVQVTQPFDAVSGLEEFASPTNSTARLEENFREIFRKAAFSLSNAAPIHFRPFQASHGQFGLQGPQSVYLIALKGKVEPKTPPLEEISTKVTNDYKNFMAQDIARRAGWAVGTNVTNGVALKKSFEEICKAENVKIVDVPPFSESTQSLTNFDYRINVRHLQFLTRDMEVGKATWYTPLAAPFAQEGGFVLYLKARPKLDDARVQAALPEYMGKLRFERQNEAFQQWFRKQWDQAKVMLPKRDTKEGAQN